jgi:hypothetical protein
MDEQNPHGVAVGQIWESCDPRDENRAVKVLELDLSAGKARVQSPTGRGVKTRISLKRFRSNSSGYRRVS